MKESWETIRVNEHQKVAEPQQLLDITVIQLLIFLHQPLCQLNHLRNQGIPSGHYREWVQHQKCQRKDS